MRLPGILVLLLLSTQLSAQISNFSRPLSIRTGIAAPGIELELLSPDQDQGYKYLPNPVPGLGFGIDYKWISTFVAFIPLKNSIDPEIPVLSKNVDWQFHMDFSRFSIDLYFQWYKGYFLDDSINSLGPAVSTEDRIRENMESSNLGMNFIYVLSPKRFSFSSSFSNLQKQQRSGGSWLLLVGSAWQKIYDPVELLPSSLASSLIGEASTYKEVQFYHLSAGGGYGYNWLFSAPWYFGFSLTVGFGPNYMIVTQIDRSEESRLQAMAKGNARLALGFNGDRHFGGVVVYGDANTYTSGELQLSLYSYYSLLYFGMRFDADLF